MKYKLAVFDLDGTILDTLQDLTDSVNFALEKNSLPNRKIEEIRSFVGDGIRLLIERSVPENTPTETVDSCFSDFKEHYKTNSTNKTKAYEGIPELLQQLKNKGVVLAVVSNKADFAVQTLVKKYFGNVFDFAVGERDGVKRKPCPDSVFSAIKSLNMESTDCVYIGDSDVDIKTARNAGVDCICVTWGFRDREYLSQFYPDYIVDYPEKISDIIGE